LRLRKLAVSHEKLPGLEKETEITGFGYRARWAVSGVEWDYQSHPAKNNYTHHIRTGPRGSLGLQKPKAKGEI
jgi:hypothetical protein